MYFLISYVEILQKSAPKTKMIYKTILHKVGDLFRLNSLPKVQYKS